MFISPEVVSMGQCEKKSGRLAAAEAKMRPFMQGEKKKLSL